MPRPSKKLIVLTVFVLTGLIALTFSYKSSAAPKASRGGGDSDLLARVITAEAEDEPYLGQVAVGAVILNRISDSRFPKTLAAVIYQPRAFESVSNGRTNQPATASCIKAAKDALGGWDPSGGAVYFFNPAKIVSPKSYMWTRKVIQRIGKHIFAL